MILFVASKQNFSLIGKGLCFLFIVKYMLDISSLISTNFSWLFSCLDNINHVTVRCCTSYQTKVI